MEGHNGDRNSIGSNWRDCHIDVQLAYWKENQVENAFGGMDVQLGKRYDLIPNLISTVKTYTAHEKDVLENVTKMRSEAISGKLSDDELVEMDNKISHAVRGIMVSCENYPDLKASSNFVQLQHTFVEVESQISALQTGIQCRSNRIQQWC